MSSTTDARAKSSDELKDEVDAAIFMVGNDLTELKVDLTPEHIINELIRKDRFAGIQKAVVYMRDRPLLLTGIGIALGAVAGFTFGIRSRQDLS